MVGVPGKSKGCHTCRRRRVKCDFAKPDCRRCIQANRTCEGYAKGSVFINRTGQGLIKRKPLEEAISSKESSLSPPSSGVLVNIPEQPTQTAVHQRAIEFAFLEKYLAAISTSQWPSPGSYIAEVISMPWDEVLNPAIQALCLTRVARINGDLGLLQHGIRFYILALAKLKRAISNVDTVLSDSTLAVAKLLNLHEVYEPSCQSVSSVFGHTAGLNTLLRLRGSQGSSSKVSRMLMEVTRYNSMMACIHDLRPTPLGDPEWRTTSAGSITEFEQSLYDVGFDIGNCVIKLAAHEDDKVKRPRAILQTLIEDCASVEQSLSSWLERFTSWMPPPSYWVDTGTADSDESRLIFPHITVAHVLMDYWSLRIVFAVHIDRLSHFLPSRRMTDEGGSRSSSLQTLAAANHLETQLVWACNIENAMHYCLKPEMGFVGPQRTMFPVGVILFFYRRQPGQFARRKAAEIFQMMRQLKQRFGLDFVDHAKKDRPLPRWAATIEAVEA